MSVQKINYANKVAINQNENIQDINKCNASDMNEIKSVVNNNADETSDNTIKISDLINFLNINNFETITSATITGGGTLNGISVTVASNSDGSLAKIYGQIDVTTQGNSGNVTINTNLRPSSQLSIVGVVYRQVSYNGFVRNTAMMTLTINTDGTVVIPYNNLGLGTTEVCRLSLFACLLFIKDFGDTPVN